jgi:hypothetical protein
LADFAGMEPFARLSADGRYLLGAAAMPHRAAVGDVTSGEVFYPYSARAYPWLGWGYGDTLMVFRDDGGPEPGQPEFSNGQLLACDVSRKVCDRQPHRGAVLLPTN